MFDEQDDLNAQAGIPTPIPNAGGQPEAPTPIPNFSDLFEQQVMQQLRDNSPEEIRKRKVKEYFDKIGLKPDTKMGKLGSFFKEASTAYTAGQNKEKYTPLEDRLSNESRAEYERMLPGIRNEASTLYTNKRAEEANRSREKMAQIKADEEKRKTEMTERIKNADLAVKSNVQGALANKYREQTEGMAQLRKALEKDPKYALATKEMKNFMAAQAYKKEYGTDYDAALTDASAFSNAMAQPSEQKAVQENRSDDLFQKYIDRENQLNESKKRSKFAPSAGGGTFRIVPTMRQDENGNLIKDNILYNGKTGQTMDAPFKAYDANKVKIDEAAAIGESQGLDALNATLGMISTGQDKQLLGPGGGNPVNRFFRALGWQGQGKITPEAFRDFSTKNAALAHTKTMFYGRFPVQAANDTEALLGQPYQDPRSLARSMAALVYSIQMMRAVNKGDLNPADIDTDFTNAIEQLIDQTIQKATLNKTLKLKGNIKLPSLAEFIKTRKKGGVLSDEDTLRRDFNMPGRN